MINNAYLIEMLANYNNNGLKEGAAMRRVTAVSVLDSVPFARSETLPATSYWDYYRTGGMYLLRDNTPLTLMYFTEKHLAQAQITADDFEVLTGTNRATNDAHLFNIRVKTQDITCKNGYVNVLERVLVPPMNMAEYINRNPELKRFSDVLEQFCAPYYDAANTLQYKQLNPDFQDSIFYKKYFACVGGVSRYPSGQSVNQDMLLPFDPGWNSYARTASENALQSDMAAMFVPTNVAMENYFDSPEGAVLKERFGSWENVPVDVLPLFVKRHMRSSLIESVPSRFANMVDEDNSELPVKKADVDNVYIGSNGVVYLTNKVYAPDDYISVYGPVLLSANDAAINNKTKIWKWAIVQPANDFRLYLNSLVSRYSFFVPTDEYFQNYIDPIAYAKDVPAALRFWYNEKTMAVNATVYNYDIATATTGDSIGYITNNSFLANRLLDLLNMHIVVGGVENGKNYYLTKGNVALRVEGSAENLKVWAGGNMQRNEFVNVNKHYQQSNGFTYFIDRPIQTPVQSVYKVLSTTPDFSEFFALLAGFPASGSSVVFVNKTNYFGIDFNIKFFNTFNYTVYVPSNQAIANAVQAGIIKPWDSRVDVIGINDLTDATEKAAEILKLERFVRYHFQDNSVFVDTHTLNRQFQSATIKQDNASTHFATFRNKYYKIGVAASPGQLTLTTEKNTQAKVVTDGNLYNIMTRDFVFSNKPSAFKNPDGTGSGTDYSGSSIVTSSTAVIHMIDNVLVFQ
ncbi:MAG: hypothetical protein JXR27_12940 [Paludibacteraceae bacterium]|nr:hypothetical protein [Paludibacteraceae bacterium]